MSDALYRTRLYWDGRSGVAKYDGKVRRLAKPPVLTVCMATIDFAPEVFPGMIQSYRWSEHREMLPEEIEACMTYLKNMT